MISDVELAERIIAFVATHAKQAASYDPEFYEPSERFNGPDAAMFEGAAAALRAGATPSPVHSTFGSGCYRGWPNAELEAVHDELRRAVNERDYEVTVSSASTYR